MKIYKAAEIRLKAFVVFLKFCVLKVTQDINRLASSGISESSSLIIAANLFFWRALCLSGLGIGLEGAVIGLVAKSQKPLQKPKKGILLKS